MARTLPQIEHLVRRAGFGGSPEELADYGEMGYAAAVEALINFTPTGADFVDNSIRTPGFVGVTSTRAFEPQTNITDARQRWLFRMVHSPAPLQEKLALFWHNHFATGYNKINSVVGAADAARLMDSRASRDPLGLNGQIELFRTMGMGKFTDLLLAVSQHASMSIWLDGRQNTRNSPQENFGREIMELFTIGVANYVETDVYAAARVFTGWNYARTVPPGQTGTAIASFAFQYNANQHESASKTFSFPIYSNGSKTIPSRAQAQGLQDGIDLINALAHHPETAKRLARKLWTFFVSEVREPDPAFVDAIAQVYLANDTEMRPVIRAVLMSPQFMDTQAYYQRYAWPVEYVIRSIKEIGFLGYSLTDTLTPLVNMGQTLYEPPDVSGWDLGTWWFSTGGMLARMNFVAGLVANQKFNLRDLARPYKSSPESIIVGFALSRLTLPMPDAEVYDALLNYVRAGGAWTGSDAQLTNKAGGTVHLLAGSADYQFV
jgi:uncharacterized protein (DUF1800 family)